jgi:hypothetical protein
MNRSDSKRDSEGTGTGNPRSDRGDNADRTSDAQHGKGSGQQGHEDRQIKSSDAGVKPAGEPDDEVDDIDDVDGNTTDNQGQKTVQGKNQTGPESKVGRTAGGNDGSKGQNIKGQGGPREGGGNEVRDRGDERGQQGGSGGGQGNRQNKEVNVAGSNPGNQKSNQKSQSTANQAGQGSKGQQQHGDKPKTH